MSQENMGLKTFRAGADLEVARRVKLNGSSGDTVVYAGDGEAFIGITGQKVASGDMVMVSLRTAARTYKVTASGVITVGATIYGDANGKVKAAASGNAIGTILEAAANDGEICEAILDNGTGGTGDGATTAIVADSANGAIPIIFAKQGITDATTSVTIVTAPFKFRIIKWWLISRDTGAANIKLVNVSTDASAVKAKGTANDAIVIGGDIIAAQKDVAISTALKVNASAAQAFDIFVEAIKVA